MRPCVFDLQLAADGVFCKPKNSKPCMQPIRNVAVQFDANFTAPALGLHHAGQSDELFLGGSYSRISNS